MREKRTTWKEKVKNYERRMCAGSGLKLLIKAR